MEPEGSLPCSQELAAILHTFSINTD